MATARHGQFPGLQQVETDGERPVRFPSRPALTCFTLLWLVGAYAPVLAADSGSAPETAVSVTVPGLIADRQRYKDKLVRVLGYVSVQVENHSLFRNEMEADTLYGDPKKGIWLRLDEAGHEKFRRFHHSYRVVTGRFRTSDCNGHLCLFSGSLEDVTIRAR